jgi:hypothetical protein
MSCKCNPCCDPALSLSILFMVLSFGLLSISYSKIFIESPLSKVTHAVDQHGKQLSEHENNFKQIYLGTFSRDFAKNVLRKIPSER